MADEPVSWGKRVAETARKVGDVAVTAGGFLVIGVVVVALAALVLVPFRWEHLGDEARTRGLVTVFFTLGTMLIALAIAGGSLLGVADDNEKRFENAKWVLTTLIGVFGTMVGFYFGAANETAPLSVATPTFTSRADGTLQLQSYVSGGRPPYEYEIKCSDPAQEFAGSVSTDGWIRVVLKQASKEPSCTVAVNDSAKQVDKRSSASTLDSPNPGSGSSGAQGSATGAATPASATIAPSPAPPPAVSPLPG